MSRWPGGPGQPPGIPEHRGNGSHHGTGTRGLAQRAAFPRQIATKLGPGRYAGRMAQQAVPGADGKGPGPTRSGRPRDEQIDTAILEATTKILQDEGYAAVSIEKVAHAAGTTRPAVYRRYRGRASLALAVIADRLDVPTPPDTGCTLCDVDESFHVFLRAYRSIRPQDLSALYADCAGDPDLRQRYLDLVIGPARTAVGKTLDRAAARGDLREDVDRDLLLDMVGSLVMYRTMFDPEHMGDAESQRALDMLLQGVAKDYDALWSHMEEVEQARIDAGDRPHDFYLAQSRT